MKSDPLNGNVRPVDILLVEDNEGEAQLFGEVVAESPLPVNLRVAQNGLEALLMLASGASLPDLIVVDLCIPYISGHKVIEYFHPKDIPVVAFTSSLSETERKLAVELGARECIWKPTTLQDYVAAVHGIVLRWAHR